MTATPHRQPFEVPFEQVRANLNHYVDRVFEALESAFLVMPRGNGFVDFEHFERGYGALLRATDGLRDLGTEQVFAAARAEPLVLLVLRTILGFTPPEWADITTLGTDEPITQGYARSVDRAIRMNPDRPLGGTETQRRRLRAMIQAACELLRDGPGVVDADQVHRLDKIDTMAGTKSIQRSAAEGIPYSALLYERFLGRPFASHRDSVSEIVGDMLELEIRDRLDEAGVTYYRTGRAEKIDGFDQAPDFFAPGIVNPEVIIEAKLTQDDGTARDKVTRLQHLDRIRTDLEHAGRPTFEVVAAIGGRGFGVRRSDMEKLILATRGKVFTLANVDMIVDHTRLGGLRRPEF